jgi:hypothetical protein
MGGTALGGILWWWQGSSPLANYPLTIEGKGFYPSCTTCRRRFGLTGWLSDLSRPRTLAASTQ